MMPCDGWLRKGYGMATPKSVRMTNAEKKGEGGERLKEIWRQNKSERKREKGFAPRRMTKQAC